MVGFGEVRLGAIGFNDRLKGRLSGQKGGKMTKAKPGMPPIRAGAGGWPAGPNYGTGRLKPVNRAGFMTRPVYASGVYTFATPDGSGGILLPENKNAVQNNPDGG
jgi:hypothetical protein